MTDLLTQPRKPDVIFHANGRIDICARVAVALGLRQGDVVAVGTMDGEYILHVRFRAGSKDGRFEGQCYASNGRQREPHNFRVNSKRLATAVIKACRREGDSKVRLCAGQLVDTEHGPGICLITRNPL